MLQGQRSQGWLLESAIEVDTGFYIQNVAKLEGLDPEIPENLPPDLVIEVDITSPSTQRLEIYHALGVPEVWRYTKKQGLVIYQWRSQDYETSEQSQAFPLITAQQLNALLEQRRSQSENQVIRSLRTGIQQTQ